MDYFENIKKNSEIESGEKKVLEDALKIALETRKFEIDLYWKRANYFWLFVSVIFVAWYHTVDEILINLLIMYLGLFVSFSWLCVNQGSKFWQENWEMQVSELTKKLGFPVFNIITKYKTNPTQLRQKYPYSVSKVNQLVSLFVTILWALMIIIQINSEKGILSFFQHKSICVNILASILALIFMVIGICIIHRFSKSSFAENNDYKGQGWNFK